MNGLYPYKNPLALTRARNKTTSFLPYSNPKAVFHDEAQATTPSSKEIWNVVSKLVHALNDARDDLAKLLSSHTTTRRVGRPVKPISTQSPTYMIRRSSSTSPSRPLSAPAYPRRLQSPNSRRDAFTIRRRDQEPYDDHPSPYEPTTLRPSSAGYSTPVAFGMNLDFEKVHRRQSPPATGDRRLPAREYSVTDARGLSLEGPKYSSHSPCAVRHSESPRARRHCTAVRYADLLKEETNHLRQLRLAGEARSLGTISSRRPSWC